MRYCLLLVFLSTISCRVGETRKATLLFTRISAAESGLDFANINDESADFDVFRYRNYYNGGGVALGDINNDGLVDVYLTANTKENRLYLNLGGFKFKDITKTARVGGTKAWSTGVSMADVNGDGFLDIYVCNSGDIKGDRRGNELFINNGDLTFREQASAYGLTDGGFSTHAAFFDYDKDGYLDCYLLNNSFRPIATLGNENIRDKRDPLGGHKLYHNEGGRFVDVSESAGIYGSVVGFGLGVTVGDVDQDGWEDIYVSNDFFERDYLYMNDHHGKFVEKLPEFIGHSSMFSMGADMADINNDGLPDIISTDMLPEVDYRIKTVSSFDSYDQYQIKIDNDYYYQYMRNMLQLNNGDGTFSEIGQLAGVSSTDWSWSALAADFDLDGHKEIFVTNGIYKDVTDQDFIDFMADDQTVKDAFLTNKLDFKKFVDKMPSTRLSNYLFKYDTAFHFANVSAEWGLDEPGFSNGAAYGDLDNDGDLDLIVNNLNQELFVYRNNTEVSKRRYLSVSLKGQGHNTFAIGARVKVYCQGDVIMQEHIPTRGFQSSMDPKMIFGLGDSRKADSLTVFWPNQTVQTIVNPEINSSIVLSQSDGSPAPRYPAKSQGTLLSLAKDANIPFKHKENAFNEFNRERLMYHMNSTQGPALSTADLNDDGLDDLFIGGARGQAGAIFMQDKEGRFNRLNTTVFDRDSVSEDTDALFFDADSDGDLDLYVVSGGSEALSAAVELQDRLYLHEGVVRGQNPRFTRSDNSLPMERQNGSCVEAADFDNDGDLDLFVGTRALTGYYSKACDQYLLQNDGKGSFTNVTSAAAPEFAKLGMVTDATWFDYDGNGFADLMVVGEWMSPTIFSNDGRKLVRVVEPKGLARTNGWWNAVKAADLDLDGDMDFVLGNLGLNSKFKASTLAPISLYSSDFDQNGSVDPIFCFQKDGVDYPIHIKQELIKQIPSLKKKYLHNKEYVNKSIGEVFSEDQIKGAAILRLYQTATSLLINLGNGTFELRPLPWQAQTSPVYGIDVSDLNNDGAMDIVMGGNLFEVKPEAGRYDAMHGLVLLGDGKLNFVAQSSAQSGLLIKEEVRKIGAIKTPSGYSFVFAINNGYPRLYRSKK